MPEGDTIFKLAAALRPKLEGQALVRGSLPKQPTTPLDERVVERVDAKGKHLFIALDDGTTIRSHLGLHGTWHRYTPGQAWDRPTRGASVVLETARDCFVCFHAKEVQRLKTGGFIERDLRRRLGPDLTLGDAEPAELRRRLAAFASARDELVDVLLDQRHAAGIGNVYKSESLFLERLHPCDRLGDVGIDRVLALYARAGSLLRENLAGGPRITRRALDGRGRLWVYGRAGRPCVRCGTRVERALLGSRLRSTDWCPSCQPRTPSSESA